MNAAAVAQPPGPARRRTLERVRATMAGVGAAALGAAPHVLHHVGPLAGTALLAGATGKLLFGAAGLALAIPMLRRLHHRTGSWRLPAGVLGAMAVVFTFSTLVIGPALTGADDESRPAAPTPATPAGVSQEEHESHHR